MPPLPKGEERRSGPVRIGVVQFGMHPARDLAHFYERAAFYVETLSASGADFAVFPEYVTGPLLPTFRDPDSTSAVRKLAELTVEVREFFVRQAVDRRINIVAGSMPWMERWKLFNHAWLCRRDGTWECQAKLHPTPGEERDWAMNGGSELRAFDTDAGRIGILVCYDVEFPEVGRMLADDGMQILFVPFCTDSPAGCGRVRRCAQARAIENECYVAVAGGTGLLPGGGFLDVHYAESAVFTPLDHGFPQSGIAAELPPGAESCVVAEVNLDLLRRLHDSGSVRNLRQRRRDLRPPAPPPAPPPGANPPSP